MSDPADPMNDNDSVFLSNAEETCRICRAEGTKEGPLFHPCKCSGSIRFVHQECLMEWLQHSQKKYCELCKTPFRFTKVYDPDMPTRLPLPIFFTLACKHLYRLVVQVLRFILVVFVWLFWLPWSIRSVWRFYFWVADGGLFEAGYHRGIFGGSILMNATSSLPLGTTKATSAEPFRNASVATGNATSPSSTAVRSSYRIGAGLANLTSSSQANQIILDTFEGQIITILVVFAFILIFLIREWVVQQQPPVPMDGNAQFGQADARVDELIAAVGRAREERAARPGQQAGDAIVQPGQQLQAGLAPPVVGPQPMFADGRRAGREILEDDENASEESIFGGSESVSSFNDGRSDDAIGAADLVDGGQRAHELAGPNPLQDLMNFVDFNPGSDYYSPRDEALQDGEALQLPSDAPSSSSTGAELQGEGSGATRRESGAPSEFQIDDNYMDSQFAAGKAFHPAGPLRRPSLDRERIAQAAEMRRNIEERGRVAENSTCFKGIPIPEASEEQGESSKTQQESATTPITDGARPETTVENVVQGRSDSVGGGLKSTENTSGEGSSNDLSLLSSASDDNAAATSSTSGLQNNYNFDLSSSGSSFQWNKYSEYSSKLDDEKVDHKGKGVGEPPFNGPNFTVADQKGEPSRTSGVSWDKGGDSGTSNDLGTSGKDLSDRWTERDDGGGDYESSEDGDVAPLMAFNPPPAPRVIPVNSMHGAVADVAAIEGRLNEFGSETTQGAGPAESETLLGHPAGAGDEDPNFDARRRDDHVPPFPGDVYRDNHGVVENAPEPGPEFQPLEQANEAVRVDDILPPVEAIQAPADEIAGIGDEEIEVDVDDLDGVLELVGMRGPLMALVQNGMFSAVLITATIGIGVWVPYIWGRIVLLVLGHPLVFFVIVPHKVVMMLVNLCIDMLLVFVSSTLLIGDRFVKAVLTPTSWVVPQIRFLVRSNMVANFTRGITAGAQKRISASFTVFLSENLVLQELKLSQNRTSSFQIPNLSDASMLKTKLSGVVKLVAGWLGLESSGHILKLQEWISKVGTSALITPTNSTSQLFGRTSANSTITNLGLGVANLTTAAHTNKAASQTQIQWSAFDQVMSVIAGYAFFTVAGAIYLQRKRAMARDGQHSRGVERKIIEGLAQAGSVMKVVLIIGIEMFVFPLYCGILLDFALLPLFENATIWTRWKFMSDYVFTSLFVHWFIGTCYMFHFALFVSMCRKIMREGVLYFIRDPDDPTFHPVKEVLERPVSTQLKKIGFSAFIYGILVVVFLGGVVWSLAYGFNGLLPIHWSSNEPVLEFPVDLLFYNFFMPMAIKYFRPSNTLEQMYGWWFRLCAKILRLSCFLFGDRHTEEEGRHVRRTWKDWLLMKNGDPMRAMSDSDVEMRTEKQTLPEVYFHRDGRFVRAPAKDSVRPGRENLFIPVTEDNKRLDGKDDPSNGEFGPNNDNVRVVYLPPHFKARIGIIIGLIWIFTAACGVAVTIGPLVFGRLVLGMMLPNNLRMNDLYAFSLGLYIFGAVLFLLSSYETIKKWAVRSVQSIKSYAAVKDMAWNYTTRSFRVLYILIAFVVVLPSLFALVMEFYVIIPIQTYFSNGEKHFIHFAQDWTLGVLYIKLMGRMLLMNQDSQWARDLRRIVHRGYLDPDVWVATKNFILPGAGAMLVALFIPLLVGLVITRAFFANAPQTIIHQVYRYSYPAVLVAFLIGVGLWFVKEAFDMWKQSLRDEIYLRGEQLHNHGENQSRGSSSSTANLINGDSPPNAQQAPEDAQALNGRPHAEEGLPEINRGDGGAVQVQG